MAVAIGVVAGACVRSRLPSLEPAPVADPCVLPFSAGGVRDTVTVGVTETLDLRRLPLAAGPGVRFLSRQLYETLVRMDCAGHLSPGLAESWRSEDGGRRWLFTLRPEARFWDGTPVTAADVVARWAAAGMLADAATTRGDRVVVVSAVDSRSDLPGRLADPALAVWRAVPEREWPLGTGPYRLEGWEGTSVLAVPRQPSGRPVLRVLVRPAADGRDLLDAGIDLLLTDIDAVVAYARARPALLAVPLPWSRTYVLRSGGGWHETDDDRRASLARDVVPGARMGEAPSWWEAARACRPTVPSDAVPVAGTLPRVLYPAGDRVARALAERVVALTVDRRVTAVAVAEGELVRALAAGDDVGYVFPVPRAVLDPCGVPAYASAPGLIPLVDVREWVAGRGGIDTLAIDWDGVPRVGGR